MYFLVVIFDSSVWKGRALPSVPIDPVDNALTVAVYCDLIAVGRLRAREVVSVVLQEFDGCEESKHFRAS